MARGGFEEEAYQPAKDAACFVVSAHATLSGQAVPDSVDAAAEYLIGEGFRQNTPHSVVALLMDGEFQGDVTEVVKQTIDWVRKAIARSSG